MKQVIFSIIISLGLASISYSQKTFASLNSKVDGESPKKNDTLISQSSFNKILRLNFGQLATGQSSASVAANFASLDIAQGKFSFNGSMPIGSSIYITTALAGKIDNSVGQLFNNFKLNNNTSIDFRIMFRIPRWTVFYYTPEDKARIDGDIGKAILQYRADSSKIDSDSIIADINLNLLTYVADSLKRRMDALENSARRDNANYDIQKSDADLQQFKANTRELLETKKSYFEVMKQKDSIAYAVDKKLKYYQGLKKEVQKKKTEKIEEIELGADWNAILLQWFSLRINPSRSKFYMIDTALAFSKQVFDTVLTNAYYGLEYNLYFYSRKRKTAHYFNAGGGYSHADNRSELETFDVTDSWKKDSSRISRTYSSKVSAYNGKLTEKKLWTAYVNYYCYFLNKNTFGIHLFPEILWQEGHCPRYNAGLGLVFSFKKKDDEKTIINAEPYIKFVDITDELKNGSTALKRNEVGVRIGIPFNPDLSKKK